MYRRLSRAAHHKIFALTQAATGESYRNDELSALAKRCGVQALELLARV
jgi:hypothetical protein